MLPATRDNLPATRDLRRYCLHKIIQSRKTVTYTCVQVTSSRVGGRNLQT